MNLFNSLIQGTTLAEILLEGHNPYALQKLETADLDALRQQVFTSESLRAFASGRIVSAGRGIWAVTDQAVLIRDASRPGAVRVALSEVTGFETERGRFGHSLRLEASGRRWSLFGVDRDMAHLLHEALRAGGVSGVFDDRPAKSYAWRDAAPEGWAQDCLVDARKRLAMA